MKFTALLTISIIGLVHTMAPDRSTADLSSESDPAWLCCMTEDELAGVTKQLRGLSEEYVQLEKKYAEIIQECEHLRHENSSLGESVVDWRDQFDLARERLQVAEEELLVAKRTEAKLRTSLIKGHLSIATLEHELCDAREELHNLQVRLDEVNRSRRLSLEVEESNAFAESRSSRSCGRRYSSNRGVMLQGFLGLIYTCGVVIVSVVFSEDIRETLECVPSFACLKNMTKTMHS